MEVLREDLALNATIATSVDLYTWSISRYPRGAESLPVFGYLRMAVGTHSLYVVILDGSGRPLAEPIRATFKCELQGNEGKAASDAFPSHDDGNASLAALPSFPCSSHLKVARIGSASGRPLPSRITTNSEWVPTAILK